MGSDAKRCHVDLHDLDATGHTGVVTDDTIRVLELASMADERVASTIEQLARWHVAEWGHLYDPDVWNLEVARAEFAEQVAIGGGAAPTTYGAFTAGGDLVGSVSLVSSDDLEGFEHVGPWLASLYVDSPWRRRGLGRRLIEHLLTQPPATNAGSVYLFTPDHADWYAGMGWQQVATATTGPQRHHVTVMVRRSTAA